MTFAKLLSISYMGSLMFSEGAILCKCLATFLAFVRSLSGMESLMSPEITTHCKPLFAEFTLEWFDACVNSFMHLKTAILWESPTTLCTFVRCFTRVNSFMHLKTAILWESFTTLSTFVGRLSCMSPFMVNKMMIKCKWLVALCTLVGFDS